MKRAIKSGVRVEEDGHYIFDYRTNTHEDIIDLSSPKLYISIEKSKVYWFGYTFKKDISSKDRANFIRYIKGLSEAKIPEKELINFIEAPLEELNKQIGLSDIDCFLYPLSGRSQLVTTMIKCITGSISRKTSKCNFELLKKAPQDIEFDWDTFYADNEDDKNKCKLMREYVKEYILPAIKNLDYFSLAASVKPKYRKYITNFLEFKPEDIEKFSKLKGSKILVVDDINTSGSTIDEILRLINDINPSCEIYVYTLIGPIRG